MTQLFKPAEAAKLAGVSYPTLKQWIYQGKVRSVKTAGGHHRIPREEIERLTGGAASPIKRGKPVVLDAISVATSCGQGDGSPARGATGAGSIDVGGR